MITIYFLLDKRKAYRAKKSVPLLVNVKYQHGDTMESFRFSTGITCGKNTFKKKMILPGEPNSADKTARLKVIKEAVEGIYLKAMNLGKIPDKAEFKARIVEAIKVTATEKNVLGYFDDYIEHMIARKGAGQIKGTSIIKSLDSLKNVLVAIYAKEPFTFDTIDKSFETKFLKKLNELKYGHNTICRYTNRLKMFLNWATINNLNKNQIYKSFDMKEVYGEVVSLSDIEVHTIAQLDIPHHKHIHHGGTRVARDWFIVSTQTGLRYSDLHKIARPELIPVDGGYDLKVPTKKTSVTVTIPVSPVLYNIFESYEFNMPLPPSNQKYNAGLDRIKGLAKLNKDISSHTGRKTFCTTMFRKGYPVQWIMKISGHKTEKEFYRYIGVDGSENAQLIRSHNDDFTIVHKPKMVVNE
jgi:integrase